MTSTDPLPDILSDGLDDPVGEVLLLQAVRDGSTAAFGILYARYRALAVGVALRSLSAADVSMAEDVAEVAFTQVLTSLRNGKGPTDTLRAYLTVTVRREAWRAQRRRRRQAEVVDQWASDEARAAAPDPPPVADDDLGTHALLGEAFRGLSDRWRHVLWLTEVEGRKPAEVAPMLGISAGSASALAYRARHGLITAYLAAYRRSTSDAGCTAVADRLGQYVAAGAPAEGYPDVTRHLERCSACRDVSRGVDVLGSVLASMAPFGLLTAGWWAQTAATGGAGLAGAAAAGAAAHALTGSGAAASTTGGVGIAGGIAAAAAVTVLAGATWFGLVRADPGSTASSPPPAAAAEGTTRVRGIDGGAPTVADVAPTPAPAPAAVGPAASGPDEATTSTTTPITTTHITTTPASSGPTTVPAVATTSVPVTKPTGVPPTVTTTTTAPEGPVGDAQLSGRAVQSDPDAPGVDLPVSGVDVVAYDDEGRLAGTTATAADGRWALADLPSGHFLVVAIVPAAYRPADGADPWKGGATWGTILGSVDVADHELDLVDLRLVPR